MKSRKISWILMFLIVLSPVLAQNYIKDVRVWGDSNIDDIISPTGSFNVEMVVNIDNEKINPSQIELGSLGTNVDFCVNVSDGYKCTYSDLLSNYLQSGQYSMGITLFDDNHEPVSHIEHSYIVDGTGPSVTLTTSQLFSNGSMINFNSQITDKAFDGSSKCSGINSLTVTLNGASVYQKEFTTKSCSLSIPLNVTPDSSDVQRICVQALDWLGNIGEGKCIEVTKDSKPPEVIQDSLNFSFEFNFPFLGLNQPYTTDFSFKVIEDHFDKDKVIVDFSQLNSNQDHYQLKPDECEELNPGIHQCIIHNVELFLSNETTNIIFDLTDLAGNNAIQTIPYDFKIDDNGPQVTSMIINDEISDPVYIGNTIESVKVNLVEEETGILPTNVFLDVFGDTKIPAETCQQNETLWTCSWLNIQIPSSGNLTISLDSDSSDAFGNKVKNTVSKTVIIDTTPPVLLNFSIEQPNKFIELNESYNNTFFECKPIIMKAWVKEENPSVTVRLIPTFLVTHTNGSDQNPVPTPPNTPTPPQPPQPPVTGNIVLIPDNVTNNNSINVTKDCVQMGNGTFYCEYVIPCIPAGVYPASFIFEDIAKNKIVKNYTFDVWDLLDTPTDYYTVSAVERMPSAFDRSTAPYINHRILALVGLTRKDRGNPQNQRKCMTKGMCGSDEVVPPVVNLKIVKIFSPGCSGDMQYVKNATLIDGSAQGEYPYFEILLKKMEIPRQNLTFNCNLSIYSLLTDSNGKHLNSIPEIENVPIQIPFFETQLPKEVIKEKLDNIKSNWLVQMDWINSLNQVSDTLTGLCTLYDSALLLDEGLAITCNAFAPGCAAETSLTGFRDSDVGKGMLTACNYVTCKKTFWGQNVMDTYSNLWSFGDKNPLWTQDDVKEWLNPRNSLVASLGFLCLPGIISNTQKLRNVECSYAYCVEKMSNSGMLTAISYCDQMHSYANCKFWVGEAEYLAPPMKLIEQAGTMIKTAASDPVSSVLGITNGICKLIPKESQPAHSICMIIDGLPKSLTAISDIIDFFTGKTGFANNANVNYCEMINNA